MKIDFDLLDKMVAAGATGGVIVEFLKVENARREPKREKDRKRIGAKRSDTKRQRATPSDNERHEATLSDSPRARLFRECKGALLTLGISDSRAGALLTQWLKLTKDDDQLVTAVILKAQALAVVDAPGWILATLREKTNGRTAKQHPADLANDLAGEARELERQAGFSR